MLFAVCCVLMAEYFDLGSRQAGAIDDAGVVQLIGQDEVVLAKNGRHSPGVCGETTLKNYACFNIFEGGNLLLKLHVDAHGARNGSDSAGTHAVFAGGCKGRFNQFWMRREPEVIVGSEVDNFFPVIGADRVLHVLEHPQVKVGTSLFQLAKLSCEVPELRTLR